MVTEVMHLRIAVNVYLDGGKPGISAGFDIKEVSLVETFDYCQLLGSGYCILSNQGCHFGMESLWKLRKTWLPLQLHKQGLDQER